jgi:hypothetical protein
LDVAKVVLKMPDLKRLLRIFAARRLVIYLTLIIGGLSLLGLIIPQDKGASYYEANYQAWAAKSLNILLLADVYHAWYFIVLIAFLAVCLLLFAVKAILRVVAAFRRGPVPKAEEIGARCEEIAPAGEFAGIKARLRRLPFDWRYENGVLYGRRRPYAALGGVFFYVGLLLILVAGLARVFGHRNEIFVFEGYGVALPPYYGRGLEVCADHVDAAVEANTGDVLDYWTTVRVLDSGKEVAAGEVGINKPLRYRGINIYQSRTGGSGSKGLLLEVTALKKGVSSDDFGRAVFDWKVGDEGGRLALAPGEEAPLGDTGLRFRYADYLENFAVDDAGINDDGPAYNPVAFVNVVNARGETAIGFLYKLTPGKSFIRADTPDFDARRAEFDYVEDGGPWREDRKEYLFASGSYLAVGGGVMKVAMGAGEGADVRARSLEGTVEGEGGSAESRYEFPFGKRVSVETRDGEYVFRFVGTRSARVTGFSVTREPGIVFFYIGCVFLTVGVFGVALLRYEEAFAFVREGRVYLAARSRPGAGVLRDDFDKWVEYAKGG